jgi:hypothetical protein
MSSDTEYDPSTLSQDKFTCKHCCSEITGKHREKICYRGKAVDAPPHWKPGELLYASKSANAAQTSIDITATNDGIQVDITESDQSDQLKEPTTDSYPYSFADIKYLDPGQSQGFIWYTHAEDTYVDYVLDTFIFHCRTLYNAICAQ